MSFNLDKIVKECPKAFSEMLKSRDISFKEITSVKWYERTKQFCVITDDQYAHFIYFRELYDFFDSVEIKIEVSDKSYESYWVYDVDDYNDNKEYFYEGFDTRTEAEYRAFEKAFEIYEKQLKEMN